MARQLDFSFSEKPNTELDPATPTIKEIRGVSRLIDPRLQEEICQIYSTGISPYEIGKIYSISGQCIINILRRNNVPLKKKYRGEIDDRTALLIVERYQSGESINALSLELKVEWSDIHTSLCSRGVDIRKGNRSQRQLQLNEDAFDEITEDSAYWAGFLMADGCINRYPSGLPKGITINLSRKDIGHLSKFKDFIGSNYEIFNYDILDFKPPKPAYQNRPGKRVGVSRVSVRSKALASALGKYGVVPAKTYIAKVYHLEMNRDFWRGVIDGDGSVFVDSRNVPGISLTGSKILVSQFMDFVNEHAPGSKKNLHHRPGDDDRIATTAYSKRYAVPILKVLYSDCKTSLDRKKAIADAILSDPDNYRHKSYKYSHLKIDTLLAQYKEYGSWGNVGNLHGMTAIQMRYLINKLRTKASRLVSPQ